MKRPIDLGHCDFELSPLGLHFSATAQFDDAATGTGPSLTRATISFSHWKDLQTLWVSQAPQLELRLFASFDPMVKAAEPAFASRLVREIGRPEVWSALGFNIILRNTATSERLSCFVFSLCRIHQLNGTTSGAKLARILHSPPEAHPPAQVLTACLAAVNIRLDYTSCNPTPQPGTCLVQKSLELLGCGLRKLFLSGAPPSHDLRPLGNGRLHKLPSLAPAVFEPTYRERMNREAVSLATITTSLLSMLPSRAILQQTLLTRLTRPTDRDGSLTPESTHGDTEAGQATDRLRCRMEAVLWTIAQRRLAPGKARNTAMPFFMPPFDPSEPSIHLDDDMPPLLFSDEEFDTEDRGNGDDANEDNENDEDEDDSGL